MSVSAKESLVFLEDIEEIEEEDETAERVGEAQGCGVVAEGVIGVETVLTAVI